MAPRNSSLLEELNRNFMALVPHNRALGLEIVTLSDRFASMRLPYRDELVGNPETGVLHGGAITALMDACAGGAVFMGLPEPAPIATLDLRIDYLRPATPGQAVVAEATCTKTTKNVAFVRGLAFHADREDPVASCAGTFMLSTKGGGREPGS
ncbi:MAG: PaaI family thioesterase [Myxococcales bacterium]|nr:PaaI family thioesterase [Myxococcales bacterium]